jgi:hypothetical protein
MRLNRPRCRHRLADRWRTGTRYVLILERLVSWEAVGDGNSRSVAGALLVAYLTHDPSPEASRPAPTPIPEPKQAKLLPEQVMGDWNWEYLVQDQSWKGIGRLAEKNVLGIGGQEFVEAWQPRGTWTIVDGSVVTVYWRTRIRSDTGRFVPANDFFRDVTCRLTANESVNVLSGNCINGQGTTVLRLRR